MKKTLQSTFLALATCFSLGASAQMMNGDLADDFTLTDLDGNTHTLSTYLNAGKTVFIDLSATWCGPCWTFHQAHTLKTLHEEHGPTGTISQDVVVLFVEADANTPEADLSGGGSSQGDWLTGTPYPVIDGQQGADVASALRLAYYPTVYKICPDRKVTLMSTQDNAAAFYSSVSSCGSIGATANDASLAFNFSDPSKYCGTPTAKVKMQNVGTAPISTATVKAFDATGAEIGSAGYVGTLNMGDVTVVEIPILAPPSANFDVTLRIDGADDNASNDEMTVSFAKADEVALDLTMDVTTDNYASEFGFQLMTEVPGGDVYGASFFGTFNHPSSLENMLISNGTNYGSVDAMADGSAQTYNGSWTLSEGCHAMMIYDSYGDGFLSGQVVLSAGGTEFYNKSDFGAGETVVFDASANPSNPDGIEENTFAGIAISPNPNNGIFSISIDKAGAYNVNVVNVVGQTVYNTNYNTNGYLVETVNLSNLDKGVYFVNIENNGQKTTQKVVIK